MKAVIFFLSGAVLSSALSLYVFDIKLPPYEALFDKDEVTVTATVTDVIWSAGYGGYYEAEIDGFDNLKSFKCTLETVGGLEKGDIITVDAVFSDFHSDSTFNEKGYYLSNKVICEAYADSAKVIGKAPDTLKSISEDTNGALCKVFNRFLSKENAPFASALLLGNRDEIDGQVKRDFTRLGLSHILAVSGMHLSIICTYVSLIVRPLGKNASRIASLLTVVFYMFITGFSASVTRSGIMLLCLMAGEAVRLKADRFTNLGVAVFLICIFDPYSAGDIGLQLSFAAVFAILLYTEKKKELILEKVDLKKRPKFVTLLLSFVKTLYEGAVLTVIIVLFMLPLEWYYFGNISLISPLTSPVFSLLCTALLWLLPLILVLSPISPLASLIALPSDLLISFICNFAGKLSHLRNILLSLRYPFAPYFCVLIFLCILVFCVTKRKKRLVSGIVTMAVFIIFLLSSYAYHVPYYENGYIDILSYKKNDGIFLVSENQAMIIDMSDGRASVIEEGLLDMQSSMMTEIETLMLTHLHSYHASTIYKISEDIIIRTLLLPDTDSKYFDAVKDAAEKNGIEVMTYTEGDTVSFGKSRIKTYENTFIKRSVQPIVRLDITQNSKTFTYIGAAYAEAYPDESFDCDYLYFGDHGPLYKIEFSPIISNNCKTYAAETALSFVFGNVYEYHSEVFKLGQ